MVGREKHEMSYGAASDDPVRIRDDADTNGQLSAAIESYERYGVASVRPFLEDRLVETISHITLESLRKYGVRRDLTAQQTGDSPRRMRNVRKQCVVENFSDADRIYRSPTLLELLSRVTQESVMVCPYEPEQMLITSLERPGDVQGWHLDDYSIALIWVAEAPAKGGGGFLQIARLPCESDVPESGNIAAILEQSEIRPYSCETGDVYIISSRLNMHRVYPISSGTKRTVMNMTYAIPSDLTRELSHSSIELLWSET